VVFIMNNGDMSFGDDETAEEMAERWEEQYKRSKFPDRMVPAQSVESGSWPVMDAAAYYGLAGQIVETIDPHTEADPAAILIQFLTAFGNVIGSNPHYLVEADKHHTNLYSVLVGQSAKARKGTAAGRVRSIMNLVDDVWASGRAKGGLSSGEGFIDQVRDETERWDPKEQAYELVDPGVADKRLMVTEAEFGAVLRVCERHGSTLSQNLRNAWDGLKLQTLTRNAPLTATNPHISIVGHITDDELRSNLTRTDMASGFANRFLFARVKRSKELPEGGNLSDAEIVRLAERVKEAVEFARKAGRVRMTEAAREMWRGIYSALSREQVGLLGAITARAEAQVVRLALISALLDKRTEIDAKHLEAGLAIWEYCEASAAGIFGKLLGDPVADEIARALQQAGRNGMDRTAIRDLFARNQTRERIGAALDLLRSRGLARVESRQPPKGRPAEVWIAV
jgi:hypothetical protein